MLEALLVFGLSVLADRFGEVAVNQPTPLTRTMLVCAFAWSLLVFGAAFVQPVVTLQNVAVQGPQPRVSLVSYFGLWGALPSAVVLVVVILVARLLGFGGSTASSRRIVLARVLASALLVTNFIAVAFTHLVGLSALPVAIAVVIAAVTTRWAGSPVVPTPGWYPDPRGVGQRYWTGTVWTEHTAG